VTGLWLERSDEAGSTLAIRLAAETVRIDHFAVASPPAIVIDIRRTDADAAFVFADDDLWRLAEGLDRPESETQEDERRIELAAVRAEALLSLGRDAGGWTEFRRADALDEPLQRAADAARRIRIPYWARSIERATAYGRAADRAGDVDLALQGYFHAVNNFPDDEWARPGLYLEFADLNRRLAERARARGEVERARLFRGDAELWYARILTLPDRRERDDEATRESRRRLREFHAAEFARGRAQFGLLLLEEGRDDRAMAELSRAHDEASAGGADASALRPAVNAIAGVYIEKAAREKKWRDVLGAWSKFGGDFDRGRGRDLTLARVAEAIGELGLHREALRLIEDLRRDRADRPKDAPPPTPSDDALLVRRADILARMDGEADGLDEADFDKLKRLAESQTLTGLHIDAQAALARTHERHGRRESAAQVWRGLGSTAELTPDERGEAMLRAGALYLEMDRHQDAIEIGLNASILEEDWRRSVNEAMWSARIGDDLRLLLARAYFAADRPEHYRLAADVLEDVVARGGLESDRRGFALYLLGEAHRRRGRVDEARAAYQRLGVEPSANEDAIWARAASASIQALPWERRASELPPAQNRRPQ
jgi:hypothetical protein